MVKLKKEYLTVALQLKVDGRVVRSKKRTYYGRTKNTHAFTLDRFAKIIFMYDHIFGGGLTYAYDGLLQTMEKKLPKKDNETAESVFRKYWISFKETIDKEFVENNKGKKNKENEIFPEDNDYLKYCIFSICENFEKQPLPVKYGFLYWFYKYAMNSSIEEIKKDLENIPSEIKNIVDSLIVKKNKKQYGKSAT